MSDYNRELHHDEHHGTIISLQNRLFAVEEENKRLKFNYDDLQSRCAALEVQALEADDLQSRLSAAEEEVEYQNERWAQERTNHAETRSRLSAAEDKARSNARAYEDWKAAADARDDLQSRLSAAEAKEQLACETVDELEAELVRHTNNDCIRELEAMVREADARGNALSVRIQELESEHQLRYGFEARLRRAEEERDAARTTLEEKMRLTFNDLKRAEAVVEAAKNHRCVNPKWGIVRDAVRQYEEGR